MNIKKIFLGADHRGFKLKEKIKPWLESLGYEVEDLGAYQLDPDDDYPDFAFRVAEAVARDPENNRGIVMCATGIGEAIAANKVEGIRAARVYRPDVARLAREHNDTNVISLPAEYLDDDTAKKVVKVWLETPFSSQPRHRRRVEKIKKYEIKN